MVVTGKRDGERGGGGYLQLRTISANDTQDLRRAK